MFPARAGMNPPPEGRRLRYGIGAVAATITPPEDLHRAVTLVSHTFTVPLDEAFDMEMADLMAWVGEAVDLWKCLYRSPRRSSRRCRRMRAARAMNAVRRHSPAAAMATGGPRSAVPTKPPKAATRTLSVPPAARSPMVLAAQIAPTR